jgi:hypothetical protein
MERRAGIWTVTLPLSMSSLSQSMASRDCEAGWTES